MQIYDDCCDLSAGLMTLRQRVGEELFEFQVALQMLNCYRVTAGLMTPRQRASEESFPLDTSAARPNMQVYDKHFDLSAGPVTLR